MGNVQITPMQIVEAFPEGKDILKTLLKAVNQEIKGIEKYLEELYGNKTHSEDLKMFMSKYVEVFRSNALYDKQALIKRQTAMYDGKNNDLDVATAKTIQIESLHTFEKPRQSSQRITSKCPFHDEKVPSFVIYKKNNSFHCFSCKSSGDSISFVMKLYSMTFVEAVKYLLAFKG